MYQLIILDLSQTEKESGLSTTNVLKVKLYNFTKEFTGNYLKVKCVESITDKKGVQMKLNFEDEYRIEDHLIPTNLEKNLQSSI